MAICSPEYLALVVTRSGHTPKEPFDSVLGMEIPPTLGVYGEWKDLAVELAEEMHNHLVALGDVETAKGTYPKWNSFVEESNRIRAEADDLGSQFTEFFKELADGEFVLTGPIERAIRVSTEAVCLMEQIDEAIADYGETPPGIAAFHEKKETKKDKPSLGFLGTVGILAITAGVAGGIYYLSRDRSPAIGE